MLAVLFASSATSAALSAGGVATMGMSSHQFALCLCAGEYRNCPFAPCRFATNTASWRASCSCRNGKTTSARQRARCNASLCSRPERGDVKICVLCSNHQRSASGEGRFVGKVGISLLARNVALAMYCISGLYLCLFF